MFLIILFDDFRVSQSDCSVNNLHLEVNDLKIDQIDKISKGIYIFWKIFQQDLNQNSLNDTI